jgi:uncharacterized membrane protein (UPF0127 family)
MHFPSSDAEIHLLAPREPWLLPLPRGRPFLSFAPNSRPAPMTLDRRLARLERRALAGDLTLLVAGDRRTRRRGLARLDALPTGYGLLFERCRSVHTIGMRFALDLLWLDAAGNVVRVDRAVAPRRLRGCRHARSVVEVSAGQGERFAAALAGPGA